MALEGGYDLKVTQNFGICSIVDLIEWIFQKNNLPKSVLECCKAVLGKPLNLTWVFKASPQIITLKLPRAFSNLSQGACCQAEGAAFSEEAEGVWIQCNLWCFWEPHRLWWWCVEDHIYILLSSQTLYYFTQGGSAWRSTRGRWGGTRQVAKEFP